MAMERSRATGSAGARGPAPLMPQLVAYTLVGLLLLVVLPTPSCSPGEVEVVSETDEKQYQLGKDYLSQGREEEALSAFLRVIDARRDAPESHLEAGHLYLRQMKDPIRAIYHFERFLQSKPQSPQASKVRQLIETAQKEFARQLPAQPYQGDLERIDLMDLVKNLKVENESLKEELVTAESRINKLERILGRLQDRSRTGQTSSAAPLPGERNAGVSRQAETARQATAQDDPDPGAVPETYTVQSGDSLSGISRRFYGTPSRWIDIYQANRDRLSSENALRVGQELRIP